MVWNYLPNMWSTPGAAKGMMYSRKRFKKYKKRKKYGKLSTRKLRLGQVHSISFLSSGGSALDSTNGFYAHRLSAIALGDVYNQRKMNNILSTRVDFLGSFYNVHTEPRVIRFALIQLRGSSDTADTSTWTDLFVSNDFTKTGISTGSSTQNVTYNINQDEYKVLANKTYTIRENGDNCSKIIKFSVKTNKVIKYEYNSTDERRGSMYLLIWYGEAANQSTNAADLALTYRIDHNYVDIESF